MDLWIGLALTVCAGLLAGNCMLPMKYAKHWPWEGVWLVFSVVSLLILPWGLALFEIRDLAAVYAALPASAYLAPVLFGAGWGVAQILFGLSMARLGLALGYAIIVGLGALLGTLVPLFVNNRSVVFTGRGMVILCGVVVMVAGIAVSAHAGFEREKESRRTTVEKRANGQSYGLALLLALLCGLMAPMLNYAFAFGQSIAQEAVHQGASRQAAGYAVWPVALLGGFVPNAVYSVWLLTRNRTWRRFRERWTPDFWLGCCMAVFWMGAMAVYGVSSVYLGALGTSIGWALFQIFMIMTANLSGVLTGEWRVASASARRGLWAGLSLLFAATAVIAAGNGG